VARQPPSRRDACGTIETAIMSDQKRTREDDAERRVPETKQQYVKRVLRKQIQDGILKPGQPLAIADVAATLGVSAIPVREAIGQLAQESLVRLRPHATPVVRGVSVDEAIWTAELRTVLEPVAAREATGRIPGPVLEHLQSLVDDMDRSMRADALAVYLTQNREFHETIYEYCQNRVLHRILVELWETGNRFRRVYQSRDHVRVSQQEHHDMMRALREDDGATMEALMYRHRRRNTRHLLDFLDTQERDDGGRAPEACDPETVP